MRRPRRASVRSALIAGGSAAVPAGVRREPFDELDRPSRRPVPGAGAHGLAAALAAVPYVIITAQFWMITDETAESANRGWKRFLLLNFIAGAIVTMLMIYWAINR